MTKPKAFMLWFSITCFGVSSSDLYLMYVQNVLVRSMLLNYHLLEIAAYLLDPKFSL